MGKIIAVANQKGGVGKTTTAVNLSAAMGERGHKTLLVDIDPQGNASSGVGIDRRSVPKSTYELLIGEAGAKEALVQTHFPNLTILPSSLNLAGAELELVDGASWISFLKGLHTASLSTIHIQDALDSSQDILISYDALAKSYTVTGKEEHRNTATYRHLIRMDGQRIADMKLDDLCICFANNPAEYWYWYLCDDENIKPEDIYRRPNTAKVQLLFIVKKT